MWSRKVEREYFFVVMIDPIPLINISPPSVHPRNQESNHASRYGCSLLLLSSRCDMLLSEHDAGKVGSVLFA